MSLYKQEIYKTEKSPEGKSVRVRTGKFYPEYRYEFVLSQEECGGLQLTEQERRRRGNTGKTNERDALREEEIIRDRIIKELAEQKASGVVIGIPRTLREAVDRWWHDVGQHTASNAGEYTKQYMEEIMKAQVGGKLIMGPNTLLTAINDEKVSSLIAWRMAQPRWGKEHLGKLTNSHVRLTTIGVLTRIFTLAKEEWKLTLPNCPNWRKQRKKLPVGIVRVRVLKKAEHQALAETMRPEFEEVRLFALASGFRKKECLLQWSEVDFDAKEIVTIQKGGDILRRPMTTRMEQILFRQRGNHVQYVFTYCAMRTTGGKVIGNRYPITYDDLKNEWKRGRLKAAKICPSLIDPSRRRTMRWHDLRHTYATELARQCNGNPAIIQRGMGQKRFESTMRYVHALQDDVLKAMEAASQSPTYE